MGLPHYIIKGKWWLSWISKLFTISILSAHFLFFADWFVFFLFCDYVWPALNPIDLWFEWFNQSCLLMCSDGSDDTMDISYLYIYIYILYCRIFKILCMILFYSICYILYVYIKLCIMCYIYMYILFNNLIYIYIDIYNIYIYYTCYMFCSSYILYYSLYYISYIAHHIFCSMYIIYYYYYIYIIALYVTWYYIVVHYIIIFMLYYYISYMISYDMIW